jgi:PKD repeat protein
MFRNQSPSLFWRYRGNIYSGRKPWRWLLWTLAVVLGCCPGLGFGQTPVLTQHNDNNRSGANLQETLLSTNNVNTNQFGLLVTRPVDDQVYAQPLIMTNVSIAGLGVHNLLIIATVNDTIYAYDADDVTRTAPYWTNSFINPPNVVPPNNADESAVGACGGNYRDFNGKFGIVGTPVIVPVTGTIYVLVRTKEFGTSFVQRLHALNVATGLDRSNPVVIAATVSGSGAGSSGGMISFDSLRNNQRPALTLANGVVYITWSSHCDNGPYHGWVIGYNASTLQQVAVYNDTPNGSEAGIWMSGQGPCADAAGNIYLTTGNGTVDATDYGESFLKLAPTNSGTMMNTASFFIPTNWSSLNGGDVDLGSAGLLLIPGTSLAISGGKQSILYLVNRDSMGGISSGLQQLPLNAGQIHGGPVWWTGPNGSYMYVWADSGAHLVQYRFTGSTFTPAPIAQGATTGGAGSPGGILSVSANGTNAGSGILWAVVNTTSDANQAVVPGTLHAYNAQNVSSELWNSDMISGDSLGNLAKFVPPTVANGKVYMATFSGRVNVYGLKASTGPARLSLSPTSLNFGAVITGQTNTRSFQVVNTGGLTLTGTVTATAPFRISSGTPFSLASNQTGLVQVAFSPVSIGNFSNVVRFTSNGGNSNNTVTGTGVASAQLRVSPTNLSFGTILVGTNAQLSFVLTNTGGVTLSNGIANVSPGRFTIVSGTPFTLPASATTNLTIRFAPTNSGSFSNAVVIASSGGNSTNALTGSAVNAAQLAVSPPNLIFQTLLVGGSEELSFTLSNTGGVTLSNGVAVVSGGRFTIVSGTPFTLPALGSTNLTIRFAPTNSGSYPDVVVITSSGGNSTNSLFGFADSPAQLRVSPSNLSFGTVLVGTNAQLSFTLTNAGTATLSNGSAAVSGGPFTIVSGTSFKLPGLAASNLTVRFAPTSSGTFSDVVTITSGGGNSTNALIGTGAAVTVANFTGSPTIGSVPLMVSFTDSSTGTITNRSWDFGDSTSTNTTVTSFTHTYLGVGTNTVRLTVSGPVGTNTLTRTGYIVVTNLGPVTLIIQPSGNELQLSWPTGTLQSSSAAPGPYVDVTNATSPFTISPTNTTQFFRVRVR